MPSRGCIINFTILGFRYIYHNPLQYMLFTNAHNVNVAQYLHPLEAEEYREVVRALRLVGEDCIKKRILMVESGELVPNDILTHILQITCEFVIITIIV